MRHVFIASLGGAPQVVTETLWALMHPQHLIDDSHRARAPVRPETVHIVATAYVNPHGPYATVEDRDAALRYKIAELYAQYRAPEPEIRIEPITDNGVPLTDIRTQRETIAYANQITRLVKAYAAEADTAIHLSQAGGRKSMSSYDQSAMMFFGRLQDELSHVLVDPAGLEQCADFWWPDQPQAVVETPRGQTFPSARESARVDLVNVPFVRLHVRLPEGAPTEAEDYERLVEFVEFEQQRKSVVVDADTMTIAAGRETVTLSPGHFFYFALLAIARKGQWLGAGPPHEGVGRNACGWIPLDDIRYGQHTDGSLRSTDALDVIDLLRQRVLWDGRVHRDETAVADWLTEVRKKKRGDIERDPTATMRSRCGKEIRAQIENGYLAPRVAPSFYGKGEHAAVGIDLPAERLELRGFKTAELRTEATRRRRGEP